MTSEERAKARAEALRAAKAAAKVAPRRRAVSPREAPAVVAEAEAREAAERAAQAPHVWDEAAGLPFPSAAEALATLPAPDELAPPPPVDVGRPVEVLPVPPPTAAVEGIGRDETLTHRDRLFVASYVALRDVGQAWTIATGEVATGREARRAGLELLRLPHIMAGIRLQELELARAALVDRTRILAGYREIYDRCMQARPVYDRDGMPTGEWEFEPHAALKALDSMARLTGAEPAKRVNVNVKHGRSGSTGSGPAAGGPGLHLIEEGARVAS